MSSIIPVVPLTGGLSGVGKLTGSISDAGSKISGQISDDLLAANKYAGPYSVYPRKVSQTLATDNKLMVNDVEIDAIRYSEVANPAGGVTINIGFE